VKGGVGCVEYNETMKETTFEKELSFVSQRSPRDKGFVVGVDEAGRGPLAGPVIAAAACYKDSNFQIPEELEKDFSLIRDSKKLSENQREKVFLLIEKYFHIGIGIVNAETIDRVNILQATFLAMKSAISDLQKQIRKDTGYPPSGEAGKMQDAKREMKFYCLVDGNQIIPNISIKQEAIIGGDDHVKSIAAASIIAKVTRDRLMKIFDQEYPNYDFARHKGYGTRAHMDALRRFGPCPIHRLSFRPVQLSIPENVNKRFSNVLKHKKR
jgi:ribonuclease HII